MPTQNEKIRKLNEVERRLRRQAQEPLTGRARVEEELARVEAELRALEITYEHYFMGIERFEPAKERQILALRFRRLLNTHIPQTDLAFRLQNLNSRFLSYCAYWDRTLRLIDEGRYQRQTSRIKRAEQQRKEEPPPERVAPGASATGPDDPLEKLFRDLVRAHESCRLTVPRRDQVEVFLKRQTETIRERFGDRPVELVVVVEDGKPKLKVRARG